MKSVLRKAAAFYPAYLVRAKWRQLLENWRYHRLVKENSLPIYDETALQRLFKEITFVDILRQLQRTCSWFPTQVYSIGGAASHSLLYILVRSLIEHPFSNVLELGVGQTTKILSSYSKFSGTQIVSLEENASWVQEIGLRCDCEAHRVYHAPLVESIRNTFWYDLRAFRSELPTGGFDLVLVDGPVGTRHFSRVGIVEAFFDLCANEWLIIWDDLHRAGDLESFVLFINTARARKLDFNFAFCTATKTVGVVYTQKYSRVGYYF